MSASESEDHFGGSQPGDEDDLFGDGSGDENLDDIGSGKEAASDRDDDAQERDDDDEREEPETKTKAVMDMVMHRHRTPHPKETGSLKSLRVPNFIRMNVNEYDADTFEPSEFDLENSLAENPKHVVRFRKDPETGELQSNANLYRWSDGSVTLVIGDDHFDVQTKALSSAPGKPYREIQDAHYYAAAAQIESNQFLVVGHVTEEHVVRPNKNIGDEAVERFKEKMAALEAKSRDASEMIIRTTIDPELQKKAAEKAEKERDRDRRRRENAAARLDGVGRSRAGASGYGDSDGGRRAATGRKRGAGAPRQKRRRPEYDSDDDLPANARRQDDYDLGDDFIAPSDEEVSEEADEEEEELLDDDDEEEEAPRRKRQKTVEADEEDAEGEADDDGPSAATGDARRGRRTIIDDDDEDE